MFGKRIELFKLAGFAVRVDLSWLILALLITWSLATVFGQVEPYNELSTRTHWIMGVFGALGLFASIVLHGLSHSLVARRFGIPMKGITLFIFGGVAEMDREPPSAKAEFFMAIAGPIASVFIAAACYGLSALGTATAWPLAAIGVFAYLGWINGLLVAFNIIPAFPLDGGRVLRSVLWHAKDDIRWATRITSNIGAGFGIVLIGLGAIEFVFVNVVGGVWLFLIGLFLRGAAQMSYRQLLMRRALEGEPVQRFMNPEPVTVPPNITLHELVEEQIYKHHFKMFPVVDDGKVLGCVTTRQVREVPREQWDERTVGDIVERCNEQNTFRPDTDAMEALSAMNRTGSSRAMVVEGDRLAGILSLKDLMKFLSLKVELEGEGPDAQPIQPAAAEPAEAVRQEADAVARTEQKEEEEEEAKKTGAAGRS